MTGFVHRFGLFALILVIAGGCSDPQEQHRGEPSGTRADAGEDDAPDAGRSIADCLPMQECPSQRFNAWGVCEPQPPQRPNLMPPDGCPTQLSEDESCLPQPPQPLQWECPDDWRSVTALTPEQQTREELTDALRQQRRCEPPNLPEACPPGQMPLLGEEQCVTIGMACPETNNLWHEEATLRARAGDDYPGALIYVNADAEPGGDGSRARPLDTIRRGQALASDGDIVVIGVGEYEEEVNISKRLALVGSCVEQTILRAPTADEALATVQISALEGAWISDLTISGPRPGLALGESSDEVRVQSVHVKQAIGAGVRVGGASSAVFADLFIDGTLPYPSQMTGGFGFVAEEGADLDIARITLSHNHTHGLSIIGETHVKVTDLVVAHTQPRPSDMSLGSGLFVTEGGHLEVNRALLSDNHDVGLFISDEGTHVEATDLVVSRTQGLGVYIQARARFDVAGAWIAYNQGTGFFVTDPGVLVNAVDLVVEHTQPQPPDMNFGRGVNVQLGATLKATRVLLSNNHELGLIALAGDAHAELVDLVVTDTQPQQSNMDRGFGVIILAEGILDITRTLLLHNHSIGVEFLGEGARAKVSDLVVARTNPSLAQEGFGRGLNIGGGAKLEASRVLLTHNHTFGMLAFGEGTNARMEDLVIRHTQMTEDEQAGLGLIVQLGANVEGERVQIADNHQSGLYMDRQGHVKMTDLVVSRTQPIADMTFGRGVSVQAGGELEIERGLLTRNHEAGLYIQGGSARVVDLVVEHTNPQPSNMNFGRGISIQLFGQLDAERVQLSHNHEGGLYILSPLTQVEVVDLTVNGTLPQQSDMSGGRGINVQGGASLDARRVHLVDNHEVGLLSQGRDSRVAASELVISDTRLLSNNMGGVGLAVFDDGEAHIHSFLIRDNELSGVVVGEEGTSSAWGGWVTDNFVGVNIISDSFASEDLECVDIRDNCCGQSCDVLVCNLESREIPIPSAADVLEAIDLAL